MISKLIIEMPRNIIKSYDKGGLISESFLLWLKSQKKRCQITIFWVDSAQDSDLNQSEKLFEIKLTLDNIFMPLISGSPCYFGSIISLSVKKVMDHLRLRTNILHHTAQLISLLCLDLHILQHVCRAVESEGQGGRCPL